MILYHGSQIKFDTLKRSQAEKADGIEVPENELRNSIYLSPHKSFALAVCSMPKGLTDIDYDNMTIKTEFPENFDPNKRVYLYKIDTEKFPKEKFEFLKDGMQVVADFDEMEYDSVEELMAGEVLKYYKLLNYENKEGLAKEIRSEFKFH